jgi:hypothetical protein
MLVYQRVNEKRVKNAPVTTTVHELWNISDPHRVVSNISNPMRQRSSDTPVEPTVFSFIFLKTAS